MPQMMPLHWSLMMLSSIWLLLIITSMIHFLILPHSSPIKTLSKKLPMPKWLWKW